MINLLRKGLFGVMVLSGVLLIHGPFAWSQGAAGTEAPASYGAAKDRLIVREERVRRSAAIQDVARTYRQMTAAFKANRIVHAEEMSQELDRLLDDPVLPEAFSKRMRTRHENFLQRIYGDTRASRIHVPDDDLSADELAKIQKAVLSQKEPAESSVKKSIQPERQPAEVTTNIKPNTERLRRQQERLERKEARRQAHLERKEARRRAAVARREDRIQKQQIRRLQRDAKKAETLARKKRDAQKGSREEKAARKKMESIDREIQQARGIPPVREGALRAMAVQERALDLRKEDVDRYVQLYREDVSQKRAALQKMFFEKVETLYRDGVEFYERRAHHFAYDIFVEIEKLYPDYKQTRHYLSALDQHFRQQAQ